MNRTGFDNIHVYIHTYVYTFNWLSDNCFFLKVELSVTGLYIWQSNTYVYDNDGDDNGVSLMYSFLAIVFWNDWRKIFRINSDESLKIRDVNA